MRSMLQQEGFIFVPDISGFTQFVNSVELEHSRHIIAELLGLLIESNPMQLKISEVEGDAILFYSLVKSLTLMMYIHKWKACLSHSTNIFSNMKVSGSVIAKPACLSLI